MSTALRRDAARKRRRELHLESLEGRALLSRVMYPPLLAAEVRRAANAAPPTTIRGHVVGHQGVAGPYFQVAPAYTAYSGHGNATPLGAVYFGNQQLLTPVGTTSNSPLLILNGSGLLQTSRGEWINYTYKGTGTTDARGTTRFTIEGPITGGTGRFNLVSGAIAATGTVRGDRITLNFTIVPKYPPTPPLPGYHSPSPSPLL